MLSIIIPVYKNLNFTKSCLKDLAKLPKDECEIIIINNFPEDETKIEYENILNDFEHKVYYESASNLGFGKANNVGYEKSSGDYILFLNNDISVTGGRHKDWHLNLLDKISDNNIISAQCGLLDDNFSFIRESNNFIDSKYSYLSGWCLAAKKSTFDKLILSSNEFKGPWNEKFFAYFEDVDLSWRARQLQINLEIFRPDLYHFGRMTGKLLNISQLYNSSKRIFTEIWKNNV